MNGEVFYQTEAIQEWAAAKANLVSADPLQRMREKMIYETLREIRGQAFTAGFNAASEFIGRNIMGFGPHIEMSTVVLTLLTYC